MKSDVSSLADWTPEEIARGKQWVRAWEEAGKALEELRRKELRQLNPQRAIALLCGPADYRVPPRAPKPASGLVEQQRWFLKARRRDRGHPGGGRASVGLRDTALTVRPLATATA